jgi:hypothetical protein
MNIITKTQDALSTTFVAILGIVLKSNTNLLGWFQFKFFEVHIFDFKVTPAEEISHVEISNFKIEFGWRCQLTNWLHQHFLFFLYRKNIRLFNKLPKTRIISMQHNLIAC